jgi:hypothetical protein
MDLPYRFRLEAPSRREAADPTMMTYHGEYLMDWKFIEASGYPVEDYAPTVLVMGDKVYLTAGGTHKLFVADDLFAGKWTEAADFGKRQTKRMDDVLAAQVAGVRSATR